ncbi:MAG: exosortase H-associated membrane protein [Parahaliea sp.]
MKVNSPYRYMGWVLLLMIPLFGLWYAGGTLSAAPAFYLAKIILQWWIPEIVDQVTLDGTRMLVVTLFDDQNGQIVAATETGGQMAFPVETRLQSFSIPFFAALLFASRVSQPFERFSRGLLILWLLMAFSFVFVTFKNLMLGLGQTFFDSASLPLPPPTLIALLYQLSVLIVPTLVPVILWLWMAKDSPMLQQIWSRYGTRISS